MRIFPSIWGQWIARVATALWVLGQCQTAHACGGFFCSRTPVDQSAERILFTVNDDDTITAYVQIQYSGDRDAFAWVVPVPSVPVLDTFPRLAIQGLDLATEPTYRTFCGQLLLAQGGSQLSHSSGVTVYNEQAVGPFETVTVGSDSAQELVTWLQDNGYRVSDAMLPFIESYVGVDMLFLAMKLLPDADVSDIEPIAMTYSGTEPMIPLKLTAVASKPELGVLAFVLADQRYGPKNYAEITISDDLIRFDENGGRNNYLALVSREIDRHGGHAFVTEYAHATDDLLMQFQNAFVPPGNEDAAAANAALVDLLGRYSYITRLYTRISPEEMTIDPVFVPASSQVDVTNVHDEVADNPCEPAPACTFAYCGPQGQCLPVDSRTDGCYCNPDTSAILTPTFGGQQVYCAPLATDLLGSGAAGGPSVCASIDCGEGTCTLINGNPSCQCTPGHVAVALVPDGGVSPVVRCVSQVHDEVDPSSTLPVPSDVTAGTGAPAVQDAGGGDATPYFGDGSAGCDCTLGRGPASRPVPWAALLGLLVTARLRCRARTRRR